MDDRPLVLLVEDEFLIAAAALAGLEDGGYEVLAVTNGEEAIRLLEAKDQFVAVVCDIRLAGAVDGWKVAKRARELCPTMPVLYVSGDRAPDWAASGVPDSIMLQKPYALAQMVLAVTQLVNAAARNLN